MFTSTDKRKKMLKQERLVKKLHGEIALVCTNECCSNKVHVRKDEASRIFQCTKCFKGYLKKTSR